MKQTLVVLTGAGISAESGIKTFRDSDGLWENHRLEDVATPEAFLNNPEFVYRFYNQRRRQLLSGEVMPNPAHLALAKLEAAWQGPFLLVTQNVDDLHERAGSRNLVHMHGELTKARCVLTDKIYNWKNDLTGKDICPCCQKPGRLRPHIVWFGEMPLHMEQILNALAHCHVFISIGTSGEVYPAAGFVAHVPGACRKIEVNPKDTAISLAFDQNRVGQAGTEVPKLVEELLQELE